MFWVSPVGGFVSIKPSLQLTANGGPTGLSNTLPNGSPLMARGWETANIIGQSKLSWVLLGFGEGKANGASPYRLGGISLEESQEDGTGG